MLLVAYATKYGSTEEVALTIAKAMRQAGFQVEARPMQSVTTLGPYDGVVLGAPLYMMRLHGDARRFLATHRDALSSRPVAFFALGPVNDVEKEWEGARRQLKKQLTKFPWFAPISTEVFGGKYDPMKLGFPFNLIPALRKMSPMDARNWEAIRTWATEMAAALQPVLH